MTALIPLRCDFFDSNGDQCLLWAGHEGYHDCDSPYFTSAPRIIGIDIGVEDRTPVLTVDNSPALSSQHLGIRRPVIGDAIIVYQSISQRETIQFGFVTGTYSDDITLIDATLFTNALMSPVRILYSVPYEKCRKNGNVYWLYK